MRAGVTAIDEGTWGDAIDTLRRATSASLACHIGPDGDALGSMLALGMALRSAGVNVSASWGDDDFAVPKQYSFMPGLDLLVPPSRIDDAPEVMVTFDAGSFARLGTLEPKARSASALVVVDHHASNDSFGSINLLDASAAASAVIVYDLLARLGATLDSAIASCLYTGLVTDTGRFQYANTTPVVHEIAGDLIGAGAPHVKITETVYNTHSVGYLKLASIALSRLAVGEGIVWTWVTQEDLDACRVEMEDIEGLIDLVRTADAADVAAVLKQQPDGHYKVSMRSRGASNVGALCEAFGGGGHALAAGFTSSNGDPHATVEQITAALHR